MITTRTTSAYVGVVFLFLPFLTSAVAQAPVLDLSVPATQAQQRADQEQEQERSATVALYLDIQTLRVEISELRGLVEELTYEIQRLQSRQSTDYANLDSRILQLSSGGISEPVAVDSGVEPEDTSASIIVAPQIDNESAADLYSEGLSSLRNGDREGALASFGELISSYPTDPVVADAYYWVGETHWVAGENEEAREAYAGLVNGFPGHRKYGDAVYKLARVYLNLSDPDQAIVLLQEAQQLGGDISARASELLEEISQAQI
jgi:TolA-binding protein